MTRNRWLELTSRDYERLAETHGTPFYLYDADVIRARIDAVRAAFGDIVKVFYAVKANPNLALLKAIREHADGLDISSGGELEQALAAGHAADRLSFAGPSKSSNELRRSIDTGVGNISVESPRELRECADIARTLGKRANIVLRINPKFLNRGFGIKMGGRPVQFGIDEEELPKVLSEVVENLTHLNFRGVHIYSGSQCFDPTAIADGVENTFRIVETLEAESSLECQTVNLGGGFGVSHGSESKELDIQETGKLLTPMIDNFRHRKSGLREVVFELGRYLTAEAGLYVTRVINRKSSRGKLFFMVDGGLHHHLSAAGTFGTALRSNFVLKNLSRANDGTVKCSVAGPSCNPTDLIGVDIEITEPQLGDLIGVLRSGSYGFTASPTLFLGRSTPVELIWSNGQIIVGRSARTMLEFN